MLRILTHENRKPHIPHLKRHIHDTLSITILHAKHSALLVGKRHDTSIKPRQHLKLDIKHISHQPHTSHRRSPKHIAINPVLVDTEPDKPGYTLEDHRPVAIVRKSTCISHHTRIDTRSHVSSTRLKLPQLIHQVTKHLTTRTHLRARSSQRATVRRL